MNNTVPEMSSVAGVASSDGPPTVPETAAVDAAPRLLLRAEAALVFVGAVIAFHRLGASWWLFAALFIAPDLSFLGYVAGLRTGAKAYNVVHTYLAPAALALVGVLLPSVLPMAAIWVAHIAADRVMGYGLKYSSSAFGETHLADPRKKRRRSTSTHEGDGDDDRTSRDHRREGAPTLSHHPAATRASLARDATTSEETPCRS